ncbi:MAG: O-antigen ligase family protein [Verrucomicrobia bacterium]|nr:O-antigen ligase family protein [Verrucomicrobiota bacterium]
MKTGRQDAELNGISGTTAGKRSERAVTAAAGCFVGLSLAKFGNPAILDRLVTPPRDAMEWIFQPWPLAWGYVSLAALALLTLGLIRSKPARPPWLAWLPATWLLWQFVSASQTVDSQLTRVTLPYLAAAVACFYVGWRGLGGRGLGTPFWLPVTAGFAWMLWSALDQHYGGLEATRRLIYAQPDWDKLSPEYLKRVASNRVFGTMMYPNALAGAILLLLPAVGLFVWRGGRRLPRVARLTLTALTGWAGLACLYWSGSKAGWLIALVVVFVVVLHLPLPQRVRLAVIMAAAVIGLAGFAWRYSGYFAKGATSAAARMDYWAAGWKTFLAHPLLGSGPGTFAHCYRRIKPPEAEMAMLTHNDYLQQASDTGAVGAVLYGALVVGSLVALHRRARREPLHFAVWLGLLAWALQSVVEFSLYIPAIGWTAFLLLGWLWGGAANAPSRERCIC